METLPDLSLLSHEQKDDIIRMLWPLIEKVRQLTARLEELEARLSKDSHNSSKPPSSDGLGKKTRSLRESSGKTPGGQAGHPGKTLKRASHADIVIEHPLPRHCPCGAALDAATAQLHERRQVFDIPVARYQVTEHRTRQLRCTCGLVHQSTFPESVTEAVQYGPNVRALAVHLTHGQLLPVARSAQLISQLFSLNLSQASVLAWIDEVSQRLRFASIPGCSIRADFAGGGLSSDLGPLLLKGVDAVTADSNSISFVRLYRSAIDHHRQSTKTGQYAIGRGGQFRGGGWQHHNPSKRCKLPFKHSDVFLEHTGQEFSVETL